MYDTSNVGSPKRILNTDLNFTNNRRGVKASVAENKNNAYISHISDSAVPPSDIVQDVIFTTHDTHDIFTAKITYLNLSKLDASLGSDTELVKILRGAKVGDVLALSIVYDADSSNNMLIPATIVNSNQSESTLIKTAFGVLLSDIHLDRNSGSEILLSLHPVGQGVEKAAVVPISDLASQFFTSLSTHTKSLQDVVQLLMITEDGKQYRDLVYTMLTRGNPKVLDNVLRRSRRVGAEQVEQWIDKEIIGPIAESQEHHSIKLIEALVKRLQDALNPEEHTEDTWRIILVPVFNKAESKICKMFVRGKNEPGHFMRFVLNTTLSQNVMQFDGLVHFTQHGSNITHTDHFALIIRSKKALPKDIINTISKIFLAHQHITGIKGIITFEETDSFPVNPEAEMHDVDDAHSESSILEKNI